ncbi:glutathione ABC transporter substrate-binding protein [Lacicoccus alkaliphilus]|uniref:Peptide/nickel transport system substrate-binding protein n=1 Tax=Lacicoccus alkaliphilus DSM 16010 TaxID=1123231 RepID=A0A1M7BY86_9BACL|nr:glutathione ABC transporter substrate-binding protein [Salinicoccus alkaliphilus]SHL59965.1 peptide/nickel transport system substrate-binding protein [Salinicoccus alkaliphilus DSM 16010]
MGKFQLSLLFVFMAAVLAACADDGDVEEGATDDEGGETAEETSTEGDITIGMMDEMVTLDLHGSNDSASSQVRRNIYETLVFQTVDMELEPGLATDWELSEDGVLNLKLREGTTFHNGSDFTAEDVKATLDRVRDEAVASQVAFLFEMIEEVEIVGDHEVNLHTAYPFAPLPSHLAHTTAGIMSKELIDEDYQAALDEAGIGMSADEYYELREEGGSEYARVADRISEDLGSVLGSNTDGTNHLQYESRSAGDSVSLSRFEDFQGGERNFENVTFRVIPENGARMAELETGGIDIATDVDSSSIDRVASGEGTELIEQESVRMSYLGFNTQKEPFDDVKVRQAISYAIDRDAIISGVYDNMGIAAEGPLAPDVWGHNSDLDSAEYDLDQARELLSETEVSGGFSTTIWVDNDPQIVDTAVFIQESLSRLGITVTIEQYEWGAYLETLADGEHDMFILGWTTVTADADYGLYALYHQDNMGAPGNRSFYENQELSDLLDAGREEADEDRRYDIYQEAQAILAEEVPTAFLFHTNFAIGVNSQTVSGIELDPTAGVRLDGASFVE